MKCSLFTVFSLFILSLFSLYSCNSDNSDGGLVITTDPYTGSQILVTTQNGEILGGDSTDWCMRDTSLPINELTFNFGPAYPNPTNGNSFWITYSLKYESRVDLYLLKDTNRIYIVENQNLLAGMYSIHIYAPYLSLPSDTIHKMYFRARYGPLQSFECEGDVLITD